MSFDYDKYAVIEIDVTAKIKQMIRVCSEELTANDIVDGLNEGIYRTTIDHEGVNCIGTLIVDAQEKTVAVIGSQIADVLEVHHVGFSTDPLEEEIGEVFLPDEED